MLLWPAPIVTLGAAVKNATIPNMVCFSVVCCLFSHHIYQTELYVGITIAIDIVLVVVTSVAWLALAGLSPTGERGATSGSGGTATASGSDASSSRKSYTFGGSSLTTYSDQL